MACGGALWFAVGDELWCPGTHRGEQLRVVEELAPFPDNVQTALGGIFDKWFQRCYTCEMEAGMYAIIETGGKQYRVSPGQSIEVENLSAEVGQTVEIGSVLLLANDGNVVVGTPTVEGATVTATVVDQGRGRKVTVFRFRGGNRYQRKLGHRQSHTRLLIQDIMTGKAGKKGGKPSAAVAGEKEKAKPKPKKKAKAAPAMSIEELDLPSRVMNTLEGAGLDSVQDLVQASDEELLAVRGLGPKALEQVRAALKEKGFSQK
jgi:large subunit ribosomal protein L21